METKDYREGLLKRLREDKEYAAEYLSETLHSESTASFILAYQDVAEAFGATTKSEIDEDVPLRKIQAGLAVMGFKMKIENWE